MSTEYSITHKHTLKILCKSKHFQRRYKRKREWVFFFWTQCIYILMMSSMLSSAIKGSTLQFSVSFVVTVRFWQNLWDGTVRLKRYNLIPGTDQWHAKQFLVMLVSQCVYSSITRFTLLVLFKRLFLIVHCFEICTFTKFIMSLLLGYTDIYTNHICFWYLVYSPWCTEWCDCAVCTSLSLLQRAYTYTRYGAICDRSRNGSTSHVSCSCCTDCCTTLEQTYCCCQPLHCTYV